MAQTYLITRTDIAEYRQISNSVYDDVINMHILDAQFSDVQKLLGADFYNDLIQNNTDANYVTLLNGGTYVYQTVTYTNVGLKAVLVHYAYSRYILTGSQTDTPFGYVEKLNEQSEKVDINGKKTISKMNQQIAFNYWENVKQFLDRNASDYPLWENSCANYNQTFRISKIGGSTKGTIPIRQRFKFNN